MSVLSGFPMISQKTNVTSDGRPSENALYDCVAASLCAGAMYLNGIHALGGLYTPDAWKDAAYGEAYVGGTAASMYVAHAHALGINLYAISGSNIYLVQTIHEHLGELHPVIMTIPDVYVPASYNWSHVVVAYQDAPNEITVLDPFVAQPLTKSDAEWAAILEFGQIWVLELEVVTVKIDLTIPEVAGYFEVAPTDPNAWLCKQTGKIIHGEILATYQGYGNFPYAGLTDWGLVKSNEIPVELIDPVKYGHLAGHGIVVQWFEKKVVIYDPQHLYDKPPGSGSVYAINLYDGGAGTDPTMKAQIVALEAQVAALQAKPPVPIPAQPLIDALNEIKAIVAKV